MVALFSLDFFRTTPQAHDAACRSAERELRDAGIFDHLDFEERRAAVIKAVRTQLPWEAERVGRLKTEMRDGRFYADLYLRSGGAESYRESFVLGGLEDGPEELRKAFSEVVTSAANLVPDAEYFDEESYRMLLERFDFKRFCRDHRPRERATGTQRVTRWN